MARPTDYSDELAAEICARVAAGASIVKTCGAAAMPAKTTVYRWAQERPEFRDRLARACEERGEALVERALEHAAKTSKRTVGAQASKAEVAAARLLIDTLFRRAGQLSPKKLGPLIKLVGDEDQPIPLVIRRQRSEGSGQS